MSTRAFDASAYTGVPRCVARVLQSAFGSQLKGGLSVRNVVHASFNSRPRLQGEVAPTAPAFSFGTAKTVRTRTPPPPTHTLRWCAHRSCLACTGLTRCCPCPPPPYRCVQGRGVHARPSTTVPKRRRRRRKRRNGAGDGDAGQSPRRPANGKEDQTRAQEGASPARRRAAQFDVQASASPITVPRAGVSRCTMLYNVMVAHSPGHSCSSMRTRTVVAMALRLVRSLVRACCAQFTSFVPTSHTDSSSALYGVGFSSKPIRRASSFRFSTARRF